MHPIRGSVVPEGRKDDIESVYRSLLRNAAAYAASGLVLLVMWLTLFVQLLRT